MSSRLNPYISFDGNAREALEFYRDVLGGELHINTFGEYGDSEAPEGDKVMHGQLTTPSGFTLMGADTPPGADYQPPSGFSISISGDDADELRGWFGKLSEGGQVTMPLEKQMWGDEFGMLVDRFGYSWMVDIVSQEQS
jgi:PhnB protein